MSAVIIFCLLSSHHCSLDLISRVDGRGRKCGGLFVEDTLQDIVGRLYDKVSALCNCVAHKREVYRYAAAARDCLYANKAMKEVFDV